MCNRQLKMRILSVHLRNIRSYVDGLIEFPKGSILLSGDIGSGKSTVLLSIEFALFGLKKRGEGGKMLLRHGASSGSVTLKMRIDSKEVTIERTLKKKSSGVQQGDCSIVMDGVVSRLSPVEMKSRVFSLLGYPGGVVGKREDLIYRFTVYTPQEAMKSIIFESAEDRLETIRRIFGIDRYKRIIDNSEILSRALRVRASYLDEGSSGISAKEEELRRKEEEIANLKKRAAVLSEDIEKIGARLKSLKEELGRLKEKKERVLSLKRKIETISVSITNKTNELSTYTKERESIKGEVEELVSRSSSIREGLPPEFRRDDSLKTIDSSNESVRRRIKEATSLIMDAKSRIAAYEEKIASSEEIISKINTLNTCPTCFQRVSPEHKKKVFEEQNKIIMGVRDELSSLREKEKSLSTEISSLQEKEKNLMKIRESSSLLLRYGSLLDEKRKRLSVVTSHISAIKAEIDALKGSLSENQALLSGCEFDEEGEKKKEAMVEELSAKEREYYGERSAINARVDAFRESVASIKKSIGEMKKKKEMSARIKAFRHWLNSHFINVVSLMEKQIMANIHFTFSSLFREWFNMLVDDEALDVDVADDFSLLAVQNGYDAEIAGLSGGEKTSLALAYRLALNKVINTIESNIKTRSILILDEPTDGFSSEQLDKVRDVLDSLDATQVIIVSHESKVESFVDSIIRVEKRDNASRIAYVKSAM